MISDRLADAPLEVTALLAQTTITVQDLEHLEVGDLIMTEKPATSPISINVGEVPKFLGHIGRMRGNRAVRILRAIKPGERF